MTKTTKNTKSSSQSSLPHNRHCEPSLRGDVARNEANSTWQTEAISSKQRKNLIPKLRFKEFEGEWEQKILGEVTKYIKGYAFKSENYRNEGVRIVRVSDLGASNIKYDNEKVYIDIDEEENFEKYSLKKNNIIITTVGSKPEMLESAVGRGIFIENENEGLLNQNMLKFENIDKISNKFLIGFINSARYQYFIKGIARGNANQSNITVKDLLTYKINLPNLPEQQKIANFLTAVDTKLQQLSTKKETLEQYKKGVMQQLFSQQLRFKPDVIASNHENVIARACCEERSKLDEAISPNETQFPDWEEKRLGEIAVRNSKKNKDDKVSFVLTNSATQGIVSQGDYFDRDIANKNNLEGYYVVEKDDFVYNPRISVHAPVGPIKRNKLKEGVMSPLYSVFRFNENNLEYFEYFFETIVWHKYLNSVANFGARHDRMNISNADFFKMPIPMPCDKERQKIATYLSAIDKKIEAVQTQISNTQAFKKGLLQQMFV